MDVPGMRVQVKGRLPRHVAASYRPRTTGSSDPKYNKFWGRNPGRRGMTQRDIAFRKSIAPHPSFDLNGDGFVGQREYFLAKHFDKDGDGILNRKEKSEALRALRNGFADDHMRDYFEYDTQLARRKKCKVMTNLMRKTVKVGKLGLEDTRKRTIHHSDGQNYERPLWSTTTGDMGLGRGARERLAGARTLLLEKRLLAERGVGDQRLQGHQEMLDKQRDEVNSALARQFRDRVRTRKATLPRTRREFLAERRQKWYMESLAHVAAKEGVIATPKSMDMGYTGAIANLPESLAAYGLSTSINETRFPPGAYRESKVQGTKVITSKRNQKAYSATLERVFPGASRYRPRKAFTSTATELFNASHGGKFQPEDHYVDKVMPVKPTETMPIFHRSDPYSDERKTLSAAITSRKYTHTDYISLGRKLDMERTRMAATRSEAKSALPAQPQSPLARAGENSFQ